MLSLSGVFLLLTCKIMPLVFTAVIGGTLESTKPIIDGSDIAGIPYSFLIICIKAIACAIVMILAEIKSGSWAKDVLGG